MNRVIKVPQYEPGHPTQQADLLFSRENGAAQCSVMHVFTPPGGGSAAGLHTHEIEQVFYIIEGRMGIEIDGEVGVAEAGSLVVFPAGVPHRNWNLGDGPTRHLSIAAPLPRSGAPFATRLAP
jgi:quercetin dioxygenase-like cupin family protein